MLYRLMIVLLCTLVVLSPAKAQTIVAVLEFNASEGQDIDFLHNLSDQSRSAASEVLDRNQYIILTRETMQERMSDMGISMSCFDGECELEVARNIQADIMVTGKLLQIDSTYVLTLKIYETEHGSLLRSVDVEEKEKLDLKKSAYNTSKDLFITGLQLPNSGDAPTQDVLDYQTSKISKGNYQLGCEENDNLCHKAQGMSQSRVVVNPHSFSMMTTEVSQKLYQDLMGENPSIFQCIDCPVNQVGLRDAMEFANALSKKESLEVCYDLMQVSINDNCTGWRIPTRDQWEIAATDAERFLYSGSNNIEQVAIYRHSTGLPVRSGLLASNDKGMWDMSGNVDEWVFEIDKDTSKALVCGGNLDDPTVRLRTTFCREQFIGRKNYLTGFRLVKVE